MNSKQTWVGGMMILSGAILFLGSIIGYGRVWPLYPISCGILMLLAPWTSDPAQRRFYRIGGFWAMLAGLAGLLTVMGVHGISGPLFMIGAGVLALSGIYQKREA